MLNVSDSVPAILENDAKGETKDIFFDIKEVTESSVVNLIWRHLAVTPGALPTLWNMLRPIYSSGLVLSEAKNFRQNLFLPTFPRLSRQIMEACGMDRFGQKNIHNILNSYHRTNAINLIGLSAGLARIEDQREPAAFAANIVPDELLGPLPPLPPMCDLEQHIKELVKSLNSICEEDGTIVASMYRHLAYWPGYLGLISVLLESELLVTNIKSSIYTVRSEAMKLGAGLANELKPIDSAAPAETVALIKQVLRLFTQHPLSKMTVICGGLVAATNSEE